jgi:hypothetical protein
MKEYDEIDDLSPDNIRKDHSSLFDKLSDMNDDEDNGSYFSMSSYVSRSREKKAEKKKNKDLENEADMSEWMDEIKVLSKPSKGKYKKHRDIFEGFDLGKKKKKKKKKKEGQLIDYKKEFEPEMTLYRNLMIEQNRFTSSLQKNYDAITSVKSTNRGVTKQMTDLMENITSARGLSMQLVEKTVNAKKLIAELTLKQKKELGITDGSGNISDFASNMLKQMINEKGNQSGDNYGSDIVDMDDDDITRELQEGLAGLERPDDVENFLKYDDPDQHVKVYVDVHNGDVNDFDVVAEDKDGNVLDDYPLPSVSSIKVNTSTNIATDQYGIKYPVRWVS